jgi:peptidoglycan/LPS O-acetylase OafA/YrhL
VGLSDSSRDRLDWIDALRGYAIAAVILYHAHQALPGLHPLLASALQFGSTGVQLFFMVSAFTLFHTLDRDARRGSLSTGAFYLRRALRILPLFYLVLLAQFLWRPPGPAGFPWADFLATATFAGAWLPDRVFTLVPGGWSIAVEMWFYLLTPLLFRSLRTLEHALLFALGAIALRCGLNEGLALGLRSRGLVPPADFLFFWLPNQLPLFALGAVAFFLHRRRSAEAPAPLAAKPFSAFCLLAGLYLLFASIRGFQALLPFHVLFGLAFLLLMVHLVARPDSPLANRPMAFLGRISYSAYFSHCILIDLSHAAFLDRIRPFVPDQNLQFALFLAWTLLLTVPLSMLLHRWVERPGQDLAKRLLNRPRPNPSTLPGAAAATVSAAP